MLRAPPEECPECKAGQAWEGLGSSGFRFSFRFGLVEEGGPKNQVAENKASVFSSITYISFRDKCAD